MCIFNILKQFLNNNYSLQPVGQATVILPKALRGRAPPSPFPSAVIQSAHVCCPGRCGCHPPRAHPLPTYSEGKHDSGPAPAPGTARLSTHSVSLWDACLLVWERRPKGRFCFGTLWGREQRSIGTILCSPSVSLQLSGIFQKGSCMLIWYPNFCDCGPGNTSRLPGSGGQWDLMPVVPQACEFTHFKSWWLRPFLIELLTVWGPPATTGSH